MFRSSLLTLAILTFPWATNAQDEEDHAPEQPLLVQCRAGWHAGDSMSYQVHRSTFNYTGNVLRDKRESSYQLLVTVLDSSAEGYRLRWQRYSDMPKAALNDLPPELRKLLEDLQAVRIHLRTDTAGALLYIEDREQVMDQWIDVVRSALPIYINTLPPEEQQRFARIPDQLWEQRGLLTKELLEEIDVFFSPFGMYLNTGASYQGAFAIPNAITGGSLPAIGTYSLTYQDVLSYNIAIAVAVDSMEFTSAVVKTMKEMARKTGSTGKIKKKDIPTMQLEQHYSFTLDNDRSWIKDAELRSLIDSKGARVKQTLQFSTTLNVPEPNSEMKWDAYITEHPRDPEGYQQRGWLRGEQGDHHSAIEDFTMAIDLDSCAYLNYLFRSRCHMEQGHHVEALNDVDHALHLDSAHTELFKQRGEVLIRMNRPVDAENTLLRGLRTDPEHVGSRNCLGYLYTQSYRFDEAFEQYEHVLRTIPDSSDAWSMRAEARFNFNDPVQDSLGMLDLRKALDLDPNNLVTLGALGNRFLHLQINDSAIHYFNRVLEMDPDHSMALHNRGYAYLQTGRSREAISDFQESIELNPEYAFAYNNIGWALFLEGRALEALAQVDRSIALMPTNAYAHFNRGRILISLHRKNEACVALEHANAIGFRKAFGKDADIEIAKHCGK